MCEYACWLHAFCRAYVEIKGQRLRIGYFLPCGSHGLNSGCQAWWQAPLHLLSHFTGPNFFFLTATL